MSDYKRLLKLPLDGQSSIFLFGPRGTGKTSWLKENLKEAIFIDLLEFGAYSQLSADPSRLSNLIPPNYKEWIVIDEVQKIPELLNEVHRLIELKKYKFILTGSSARSLKRAGVNLLAGRALRYVMHPLVIQEIGDDFNFDHVINFGLLPSAVKHQDPKKYLESYVHTYVKEEVLQEGLTRNIGAFTKFLEAASFSQGNVLNVSEISRELGLNRLVVANYFDILDDLLLSSRIEPFSYRAKRKVISHQKFYFFDAGVYRTLRPMGPLDSLAEAEGAILETLFFQSLSAINDYLELGYTIYFWRTTTGQEIDFVLYGPRGLFAFEIKRSSNVSSQHLKALKDFKEDYPQAKTYLINLSEHPEYHQDISVIPFVQALKDLPKILS